MSGRVLLLHGIGRRPGSMGKMERAVAEAGFETRNLSYPSRIAPIEALAEIALERAAGFLPAAGEPLHFVGHSMGGLVARAMIRAAPSLTPGRVVTLGSPHRGSEIADLLWRTWPYRRWFGPAGAQLTTQNPWHPEHVTYELGAIAGDRTFDPLCWWLIPGPNDGKVAVARAGISGMADFVTLHAGHTFMPRNRAAIEQTIHFLRHGRFK